MYRGALTLLSDYGGDSSEDEVPIGRVSTKRCHSQSNKDSSDKRLQTRLPVPEVINQRVSADQSVPVDDPLQHSGRIRAFPHERGNWATYVYIPYEPSDAILKIVRNVADSLQNLELRPVDHFHISLTKTVILRHHWIDSFVQSVREKVSFVTKFVIVFDSLKVYCNEERTRTFIGLEIKSGHDTLIKLVECLNICLAEFRLPVFYKDPSFHMSIAWCIGDHESEINRILPMLRAYVEELLINSPDNNWFNYVMHLECKSGNKLFNFNLL